MTKSTVSRFNIVYGSRDSPSHVSMQHALIGSHEQRYVKSSILEANAIMSYKDENKINNQNINRIEIKKCNDFATG